LGILTAVVLPTIIPELGDIDFLLSAGLGAFIGFSGGLGYKMMTQSGAGYEYRKKTKYGERSDEEKQFFEGKLLEDADLRRMFAYTSYSKLGQLDLGSKRDWQGEPYKGSGILVKAELQANGRDINVCLGAPIHTMIIGNTGSGKTQAYISPTIQVLAELPKKPSMVVGDVKGELYDSHSEKLRRRGYRCVAFNLREPFKSDRWNPLARVYRNYMRFLKIDDEIKKHTAGHPRDFKLKFAPESQFSGTWYELDRGAYPSWEQVQDAKRGVQQALTADIATDVNDICLVIIPDGSDKEKMWNTGARDFCKAVMFAMVEDLKYPELGMTKEKFNLFNFYTIVNHKDPGDDPFATTKKYLEGRSEQFKVTELASTVLNAPDATRASYISVMGTNISFMADPGIAYVTSGDEIDFRTFDDKYTALFLMLPDEKITMHRIASMAISQLYKELVELANKNHNQALKQDCHFILDEFANLPKIEGMDTYITVARSRRIIFHLVLQSYMQLAAKYEQNPAEIIKTNCNIHVFIGSGDDKTVKEFSDKCGTTVARVENDSVSRNPDGKGGFQRSRTESENYQSRPLIFPEQLRQLEKQSAVILMDKTPPFFTKLTFTAFAKSVYEIGNALATEFRPAKYLDVDKVRYGMQGYIKMRSGNSGGGGAPNTRSIFDDDF
ncbi:MAG: type IV secretory system conjugative DNA transfer family protein, partial [Firmicutes bacterium]|nr:type IV secretory system conjugative DNA transfer family protein [Bacillota bacterium]